MTPEILAGVKVFVGWWAVWFIVFSFVVGANKRDGGDLTAMHSWVGAPFTAFLSWVIWWGFW